MQECFHCNGQLTIMENLGSSPVLPSNVVRCGRCGLMYKDPLPDQQALATLYNRTEYSEDGYFTNARETNNQQFKMWTMVCDFLMKNGIKEVLDIGCGDGAFLDIAKNNGMETHGVELSGPLFRIAARNHRVRNIDVRELGSDRAAYGAITIFDFIEHLADPFGTVRLLADKVCDRGYLVVFTPDMGSFQVRSAQKIQGVFPPLRKIIRRQIFEGYHLFFFNRSSLRSLLREAGFVPVLEKNWPLLMRGNEAAGWLKLLMGILDVPARIFGNGYRLLMIARKG